MTRSEGKLKVEQLVEDFARNEKYYTSTKFNETEARDRFIDPLFAALGWQLKQTNLPMPEWDVHREYSLKGKGKRPDYAFRADRKIKFFVEAKAPHVQLTKNDPVFQAKQYAFSSSYDASVVILTDFEEFRVFNALDRPVYENPLQGLLKKYDLKYTKFIDKWDTLYETFSREAVYEGSIEALRKKLTKNTKPLDDAFLDDISNWREVLARHIAVRNPDLSVDDLNEAVQRILDRLIFIRNLEDRHIEPENTLYHIAKAKDDTYPALIPLFNRLDNEYNGLLFKKHFSESLTVDDRYIKKVIYEMCYPKSPFRFDVIPPEILGRIYERFLGSKIRLTDAHRAKVEEKPEVRKAGGVYYTPQYIVDYIVKNTVGKLLNSPFEGGRADVKGLEPDEIKAIKILDPACGSGSFLLGALDYLFDYHKKWYAEHGEKYKKKYKDDYYHTASGDLRLTIAKKSDILKNNIFGVDIDREATEVAIMSLYLKLLEDGYDKQMELFGGRTVLPVMMNNIKCGNSLIGSDFYSGQGQLDFGTDTETIKRINAFDWEQEFPEIFANGGFDCVIGNPPYIRIQAMKEWASTEVEFYKQLYKSASKGNYDIYVVFVEKGLSLLNETGLLGFILPHKFFNAKYGEPLRKLITKGKYLFHVIHFESEQVFIGATTYTCLMFLSKLNNEKLTFAIIKNLENWMKSNFDTALEQMLTSDLTAESWSLISNTKNQLMTKIIGKNRILKDIADRIFQGFKTGADSVYILDNLGDNLYYSKQLNRNLTLENIYIFPLYKSGNFKKYNLIPNEKSIIFPYKEGKLIRWKDISENAPLTAEYLLECKSALESRENGRWKGKSWYCYSRSQALTVMTKKKILTADLNPFANYCIDTAGTVCFTGGAAGGYGIVIEQNIVAYVLGLLNSKLLDWFLQNISSTFRGGWYSYESRYISQIPIRLLDLDNPEDKADHDQLVQLVDTMLTLHKDLAAAKSERDKTLLQRQITLTDNKIDNLVYALYELTPEEIKIVEGKAS